MAKKSTKKGVEVKDNIANEVSIINTEDSAIFLEKDIEIKKENIQKISIEENESFETMTMAELISYKDGVEKTINRYKHLSEMNRGYDMVLFQKAHNKLCLFQKYDEKIQECIENKLLEKNI